MGPYASEAGEPASSHAGNRRATMPPFVCSRAVFVYVCFSFLRRRFSGQHRSLGPSISKVRSLKLDGSIWSNELVEVGSTSGIPAGL